MCARFLVLLLLLPVHAIKLTDGISKHKTRAWKEVKELLPIVTVHEKQVSSAFEPSSTVEIPKLAFRDGQERDSNLTEARISNLTTSRHLRETQMQALSANLNVRSTSLQTWNAVLCPDPMAKLQTCPVVAAWIGLRANPPCDCVQVFRSGLNAAKIYGDPMTKIMIEGFQNTLKTMKHDAICGTVKKAAKDARWAINHDPLVQAMDRWNAAGGTVAQQQAYMVQILSASFYDPLVIGWRNAFAQELQNQKDYCNLGGEHPLVRGRQHHSPFKGHCFSNVKKVYKYYKATHCWLKGLFHNKPKCPDPACPPAPQLNSFIPPWLTSTPGACFFNSVCQPAVNELFHTQCQATVIAMNDEVTKCLQISKDDTYHGLSAPTLPDPGKHMSKKEFKQGAKTYYADDSHGCLSTGSAELCYFTAWSTGQRISNLANGIGIALLVDYTRNHIKHCLKKAFRKVFGCQSESDDDDNDD